MIRAAALFEFLGIMLIQVDRSAMRSHMAFEIIMLFGQESELGLHGLNAAHYRRDVISVIFPITLTPNLNPINVFVENLSRRACIAVAIPTGVLGSH